uniref:Ig-like domain-containing protein n=1 Tax=Sinocyclocheilus rhinocerous TaxID=307959 RepID=A0A673M3N3_9TELE
RNRQLYYRLFLSYITVCLCWGQDRVEQPLGEMTGENVTLSCNYSTTGVTVNSLQWYRQYLKAKPTFLLLLTEYSNKSEPDLRLYSKATKEIKRVDLIIFSAAVTDSAVYYCALQPTVTGNTTIQYRKPIHNITVSKNTMILHSVILLSALACKYHCF